MISACVRLTIGERNGKCTGERSPTTHVLRLTRTNLLSGSWLTGLRTGHRRRGYCADVESSGIGPPCPTRQVDDTYTQPADRFQPAAGRSTEISSGANR